MTGIVHKGMALSLDRAWRASGLAGSAVARFGSGGSWSVSVDRGCDPCAWWHGGTVVSIRHYGTLVCVIARATVCCTATSASDRDALCTVVGMLCPSPVRISLAGGTPAIAEMDVSRWVECRWARPHGLDDLADSISELVVLPSDPCASETFLEGVARLLAVNGREPSVDRWGNILWGFSA